MPLNDENAADLTAKLAANLMEEGLGTSGLLVEGKVVLSDRAVCELGIDVMRSGLQDIKITSSGYKMKARKFSIVSKIRFGGVAAYLKQLFGDDNFRNCRI